MLITNPCVSDAGGRVCPGVQEPQEHASTQLLRHSSSTGIEQSLTLWFEFVGMSVYRNVIILSLFY